ncbi:MAG: chemotaxis protein CheA [Pseudomonadota bacterium]
MMDANDELRETFFQECDDLLETLESGLLQLQAGDGDRETVNAVFRAVHSIKGGAGAFALDALVKFAHKFETSLDRVRDGVLEPTPDILAVFLRASDILSDLVNTVRDGSEPNEAISADVLAELSKLVESSSDAVDATPDDFAPLTIALDLDLGDTEPGTGALPEATSVATSYTIRFKPHTGLYVRGNEPLLILRALAEFGDCEVECHILGERDFEQLEPEDALLSWDVTLMTSGAPEDLRDAFDFVVDDCDLEISPTIGADDTKSEDSDMFDAPVPVDMDSVPAEPLDAATPTTVDVADAEPGKKNIPETERPSEPALDARDKASQMRAPEAPKQTIRVDLDRIERLINLVGELVITQAMLTQRVHEVDMPQHASISEGLDDFKMLTRDIQESVMAIRAQPVKPLFQRMTRIVRESALSTGKAVRLVAEGEATEVDKTIVERLADPLTHMIRNAVDHGLETPEARLASGKPREGVVRLIAAHRSGRIVIEVADDGAGINRERVRNIAIEKELIAPDAQLSDSEIDNLLFMPGFSTAKEVSNLSGRGVGMDVVKRAIQSLGGRTLISSEPGKGTSFSISLPLTLAVLDGIVVTVADQTIVVPLTNIVETFRPNSDEIKRLGAGTSVVLVRGEPLPIIDVGHELGFRPPVELTDACVFIVTETHDGAQNALVVDSIIDQRQVVIKGLEANYGEVPGVAAATILGDGRIALILDVDVIVRGASTIPTTNSPSIALTG